MKFIPWPLLIFQFLVCKITYFGNKECLVTSTRKQFLSPSQVSYSIGCVPSFQSLANSLWEKAEFLNKTIQNKTKILASPTQQTLSPSHMRDAKGSGAACEVKIWRDKLGLRDPGKELHELGDGHLWRAEAETGILKS